MIFGVTEDPKPPQNIVKVNDLSSSSSIYLWWDFPLASNLDIEGYNLYIDDGLGGDYKLLYDGSQNPQVLEYEA